MKHPKFALFHLFKNRLCEGDSRNFYCNFPRFTIARQMNNAGQEEHYVCLSLALSARDKALMVSTQESKILFVGLQLGY